MKLLVRVKAKLAANALVFGVKCVAGVDELLLEVLELLIKILEKNVRFE